MKEVLRATSTNGRWGLAVVAKEDVTFPAEGTLSDLGTVAGIRTFQFEPGATGLWAYPVGSDVKIHGGATEICRIDLQSSACITLLQLGPESVLEFYGYKGRSSSILAFIEGIRAEIPEPVLLAMGLIKGTGEIVEIEPPAPLQGAMAEAFQRLRRA